jgi:ATP-dependent DNA helicase RecG
MGLTEARLVDDQGASMKLVWFNQPYLARSLQIGGRVAVAGKVVASRLGSGIEMRNPLWERLEPGSDQAPRGLRDLMPRYPLSEGLSSRKVAEWVLSALHMAGDIEDVLPDSVRERHNLLPVAEAVDSGHRPESLDDWRQARRRMTFAELFELQMGFSIIKRQMAVEQAEPIPYRQEVIDAFKDGLGFALTNGQRRATWEVFKDLAGTTPMNRLLNGDVGSGKTAVAAAAVAMTHAAGRQSVVMAPTEILARQHLHRFRTYLEGSFPDLKVELLVSGLGAAERRRVAMAAASGHCGLLVGTHALIEEVVELADLGLAVVDEQHRFGTRQRELLRAKGQGRPHFLAMTATPIPRTLALAMYGEMSLSILDEMPPGRSPVKTEVVTRVRQRDAYELVLREVAAGRQAFVICPLVEASEKLQVRAATEEYERLRHGVFKDLRVGLVHGKLKEKDEIMRDFAAGACDVLVATSVVEVGVDVPNATVMIIDGAERFGLAQLHQFRGRVGRGSARSHCLLFTDEDNEAVLARLELVARVHDGFRLAEEDMRLRGMGQLMGPRQHGMTDSAMDALLDPVLLSEVREEADRVLESDPDLKEHPALRAAIARRLEVASIS